MMLKVVMLLIAVAASDVFAIRYEAKPGQWPWNVCTSVPYKAVYPNWLECRAEVARLNGIEDSDEAFRRISPDRRLLEYPALTDDEAISKAVEKVRREKDEAISAHEREISRLKGALKTADEKLARALAEAGFWFWRWGFWELVLIGIIIALTAALVYLITIGARRDTRESFTDAVIVDGASFNASDIRSLQSQLQSMHVKMAFLEETVVRDMYRHPLPPDIRRSKRDVDYMYFPRAGADEVWINQIPHPVKISNINAKLDSADIEALRYYGLYKDTVAARRTKIVR